MKHPALRYLVGAFLVSASVGAFAATNGSPVAEVVDVVKDAFHAPPGENELPAKIGDSLQPDEAIRTAADSAIEISFPDGATLRLESDSDMVLDSYVFDPSAQKSAAAITVPSGMLRYTTGETGTDDSGVEFSTPVATVGIRGTDIVISVNAQGATVVDVLGGKVSVKPTKNATAATAEEGQSVLVEKEDMPPQVGTIGDFATAAGTVAPPAQSPKENGDQWDGPQPKQSNNSPTGSNAGGGTDNGGGSSGGGSSGGGQSDSDGDGNAGHGDNSDHHDSDNPGGGKGGGKGSGKGGKAG